MNDSTISLSEYETLIVTTSIYRCPFCDTESHNRQEPVSHFEHELRWRQSFSSELRPGMIIKIDPQGKWTDYTGQLNLYMMQVHSPRYFEITSITYDNPHSCGGNGMVLHSDCGRNYCAHSPKEHDAIFSVASEAEATNFRLMQECKKQEEQRKQSLQEERHRKHQEYLAQCEKEGHPF